MITDVTATADFAGQINGLINFTKTGTTTLTLHDNSTYAGTTTVQGNVLSLVDQGRLSGTTQINVNNAVLRWDDSGIQAISNRIGATATANVPLTLDGGAFQFISRSGTNDAITLGNLERRRRLAAT